MSVRMVQDSKGRTWSLLQQNFDDSCGPTAVAVVEVYYKYGYVRYDLEAREEEISQNFPDGYRRGHGSNINSLAEVLDAENVMASGPQWTHPGALAGHILAHVTPRTPMLMHVRWKNGGGHFVVCIQVDPDGTVIFLDSAAFVVETRLSNLPRYRGAYDEGELSGSNIMTFRQDPGRNPINQKYRELGGASGFLGYATSDEHDVIGGGKAQTYQRGAIYYHAATGAFEVHGDILRKFVALGETKLLGYPTSDESAAANGGRISTFQRGIILWGSGSNTHEVHGDILKKYQSLNREAGFLGYPTSDEQPAANGGRISFFQRGIILWGPGGTHEVHGDILQKYRSLGGESGFLGFPTSDELAASFGGRVNFFQNGVIFWSAAGTHEIHGAILSKYASMDFERSFLRFPTSDEHDYKGGRISEFQGGAIVWNRQSGAVARHREL